MSVRNQHCASGLAFIINVMIFMIILVTGQYNFTEDESRL